MFVIIYLEIIFHTSDMWSGLAQSL